MKFPASVVISLARQFSRDYKMYIFKKEFLISFFFPFYGKCPFQILGKSKTAIVTIFNQFMISGNYRA